MESFKKKAVALKYDFHSDAAPRILAKGEGVQAVWMERLAVEQNIPVTNDPRLSEALSRLPVLSEIPEPLYELIAVLYFELLSWDREVR